MNRDVYRRRLHLDYSVDILLGQVRQRYIVAHQEGKSRVVVLEVQRVAHSLRKLVYEAEHALVAAGVLLVHQVGLELEPYVGVLVLLYRYLLEVRTAVDEQSYLLLGETETVIEDVVYVVTVYRDEYVPGKDAVLRGGGGLLDPGYRYHSITFQVSIYVNEYRLVPDRRENF